MKQSRSVERRLVKGVAVWDLFLTGIRVLGTLTFSGFVIYKSFEILIDSPEDALPAFVVLLWIIAGFMNVFVMHQLYVGVKLWRSTCETIHDDMASHLAYEWGKGHASFLMSLLFDVLLLRYIHADMNFLFIPGTLLGLRVVSYIIVRKYRKDLLGNEDEEDEKCII